MNNYNLTISYLGADFCGSQVQPHQKTVESELEKIIRELFPDLQKLNFAGRTDTGVHAEGMNVNYLSSHEISPATIKNVVNRRNNKAIQIENVSVEPIEYHARMSAKTREYKYLFTNQYCPLYLQSRIPYVGKLTYIELAPKLTDLFIGEHDFSQFRKVGSNESTTVRNIIKFEIKKKETFDLYKPDTIHYYEAHIIANSYLYRMIRNIMGSLFKVFNGIYTLSEYEVFIKKGSPKIEFTPAPAKGLSLTRVNY